MIDLRELERRITVIEDLEAIKRLKYRYWRHLDLKQWDDLARCFVNQATVSYGGAKYEFAGLEAIMRFLRESLGRESGTVTIHHGHHPEIELTSATTARGTWALYNYMYNEKQNRCIRIGAYYQDEYVKDGADWKFQHIGYTPIFHEEWKRSDVPSLRIMR